jgi:hypothetical protein
MNTILELECAGYTFNLDGDQIRYTLAPGCEVNQVTVRPLLEELRVHKADAITFLRQRKQELAKQKLIAGTSEECNVLDAALRERIRQRGFCLVRSAILGGELIAVIEDSTWRSLVPARYIVYTRRELRKITEGFRTGHIVTIGDLRLLHSAKKYFKGVIIQ